MQDKDQAYGSATGKKFGIVVLISGRGSNLKALADSVAAPDSPARIVAVVSDTAKAAGLEFARSHEIPVAIVQRNSGKLSIEEFNSKLAETVATFAPDLVVLAGFMRILTKEFTQAFADRIINIHPSLLPAFRGLKPHAQALAAGVLFSGCTIHFVTEEVDGGPIIAQAVVPVLEDDSEELLAERILAREHQLLPAVTMAIAQGSITLTRKDGIARVRISSDAGIQNATAFLTSIN